MGWMCVLLYAYYGLDVMMITLHTYVRVTNHHLPGPDIERDILCGSDPVGK